MEQANSSNPTYEQASAAAVKGGATTPVAVIIEQRGRVADCYSHVFDYLGVRLILVRSVAELRATLFAERPMAVIWELDAGLDSGEVLHTVSELDRHIPVLLVAGTDARTMALLDSMIRFWRMTGVTKLAEEPQLQELVEFLFRAGRRTGEFRVLSV